MPDSIRNIAVIGAGTMGQGISQVCALAGYSVMLYDIQADITKTAIATIRKNLDMAVEKNKITSSQKDEALSQDSGCW